MTKFNAVIVVQLTERNYKDAMNEMNWITDRIEKGGTYRDSHSEYLLKSIVVDQNEPVEIPGTMVW